MTTDNAPAELSRYAKAIAKVVEAGGPELPAGISLEGQRFIIRIGGQLLIIDDTNEEDERMLLVARLEKHVREDVVVWADEHAGWMLDFAPPRRRPRLRPMPDLWMWCIDGVTSRSTCRVGGRSECPTESHIAFLEAIAEVVAGEKGEVQDG